MYIFLVITPFTKKKKNLDVKYLQKREKTKLSHRFEIFCSNEIEKKNWLNYSVKHRTHTHAKMLKYEGKRQHTYD